MRSKEQIEHGITFQLMLFLMPYKQVVFMRATKLKRSSKFTRKCYKNVISSKYLGSHLQSRWL